MPSNEHFKFSILIGGTVVPEYDKDGRHYVECNLSTPVSYKLSEADVIAGELEKQEWPVTPYSISIETRNLDETCYFRVLVDGVKVKAISLGQNATSVIKGFRDGSVIREFLFSMPRFAKDSDDRLEPGRECNVGCIEVECWKAELKSSCWKARHKALNFQQANKKDVYKVTNGEYTMVTSKVGKPVSRRSILRKVDSWKRKELLSSLKLHYRMGHTLQEMGFTLKPFPVITAELASNRHLHNTGIKREDGMNTQTDDVIKIDDEDDGAAKRVEGVIDLTADSDDDMNVLEDGICDVPANSSLETPGESSENQPADDSGGKKVLEEAVPPQADSSPSQDDGSAGEPHGDMQDDMCEGDGDSTANQPGGLELITTDESATQGPDQLSENETMPCAERNDEVDKVLLSSEAAALKHIDDSGISLGNITKDDDSVETGDKHENSLAADASQCMDMSEQENTTTRVNGEAGTFT